MGIEVNNAGTVIKAAVGAQWMSAHDRHTQGAMSPQEMQPLRNSHQGLVCLQNARALSQQPH
jgi:hypothetical protein